MTKEEKLQTEVITTEQAIYCMNHQYNYEKYECDYCPYCLLCEEKGIEGKMIKMAIKALEENEGLKHDLEQAKQYSDIYRESANRLREKVGVLEIEIQKAREEMQSLRNCTCSCSDGIIDDVEEILDKYLGEKLERGETDGRD